MHTNVILTNKTRIHTQSNYTNTWFRHLLRHPATKWSGPILQCRTHTGDVSTVLQLSNELDELSQWHSHDCSTITVFIRKKMNEL